MKTVGQTYGALWASTGLGAIAAGLGGAQLLHVGKPHDALHPTVATALDLLAHNALVALWPIALATLGWAVIPAARRVGDVLVGGQIALHGLLVGGALGQQRELWRYLPHLPFEWLGLALPAAGWLLSRHAGATPRRLSVLAAASIAALSVAAAVETWAVPL